MNKMKLKILFAMQGYKSVKSDKGLLMYEGTEIKDGTILYIDSDEDPKVAEDGEYLINDKKYIIKEGKVSMDEKPEEVEEEMEVEKPVEVKAEEVSVDVPKVEDKPKEDTIESLKGIIEGLQGENQVHKEMLDGLTQNLKDLTEALAGKFSAYDSKFSKLAEPQDQPANLEIREVNNGKQSRSEQILSAQLV